jgi:hypothetical protein
MDSQIPYKSDAVFKRMDKNPTRGYQRIVCGSLKVSSSGWVCGEQQLRGHQVE